MKQFLAFVLKEFYHIIRDKRTMLILLGIPIVQIILFGFALTTEVNNVRVAVLNPSNDVTTRQIIDQLDASNYFKVTHLVTSPADVEKLFRENKIDLVVNFENGFASNLHRGVESRIQLVADATDPNTALMLVNHATGIISGYGQSLPAPQATTVIISEVKFLYNPQMKSAYNFVPGVMGLILMLICAMMTSISIVREKEMGTMEVLLASPIKPIFIILAKTIPYFVLSCVNLATILLLSVFVLDVPVAGSLPQLTVVSALFIVVTLSLGLLISTLVQTQVAAMLISGMALIMPVMLLSGMIFPVESMPSLLQWISHIIPAKWFIIAVKKIMIEGLSITYVGKEMAILALMGIMILTVSLKKFKIRL